MPYDPEVSESIIGQQLLVRDGPPDVISVPVPGRRDRSFNCFTGENLSIEPLWQIEFSYK